MKTALFCLAPLLFAPTLNARTWKDASGKAIEVKEWRVEGEKVVFVINGRDVPYDITRLSKEDKEFIKNSAIPETKTAASTLAAVSPQSLPGGDVLLTPLPLPLLREDALDWNPLRAVGVLNTIHDWKVDVVGTANKAKWDPESDHWDEEPQFYELLAKEAKVRMTFSEQFDLRELVRQIDKGQPMICWMGWTDARAMKYVAFKNKLQQDSKAELPSPRDDKERALWVVNPSDSDATTALLVGYNKKRGEIIFSIPRDSALTELRMREEEIEVIGYSFWTFERR